MASGCVNTRVLTVPGKSLQSAAAPARTRSTRCYASLKEKCYKEPKVVTTHNSPSFDENAFDIQRYLFHQLCSIPENTTALAAIPLAGVLALSLLPFPDSATAADVVNAAGPLYHPISVDMNDLAAQEEFWSNMLRYAQYFVSVMLGTAYVMTKPIVALFKRPVTAVLGLTLLAGLFFFISFTVQAMLGLTDPVGYQPSSIVTPYPKV